MSKFNRRDFGAGFLATILCTTALHTPAEASKLGLRFIGKGGGAAGLVFDSTRDQSMGATDASGMVVSFPFRAASTARQIWVDDQNGSDTAYNGYSPYPGYQMNGTGTYFQNGATGPGTANSAYGPLASAGAKIGSQADQSYASNQLFFAEGGTYSLATTGTQYSIFANAAGGSSAAYPTCIQSYDRTDPLNLAKHGRAGTAGRGARPILTQPSNGVRQNFFSNNSITASPRQQGYWALRGIKFYDSLGSTASGLSAFVLAENCIFDGVQFGLETNAPNASYYPTTPGIGIIRLCVFMGQGQGNYGSKPSGTFSVGNLTLEDNFFYHCGFPYGIDGRSLVAVANVAQYNHAIYSHGYAGLFNTIRRNVFVDSSGAGISCRNNGVIYNNVLINCPRAIEDGGSSGNILVEHPEGSYAYVQANLILGSSDYGAPLLGFSSLPAIGSTLNLYSNGQTTVIQSWTFIDSAATPTGFQIPRGTDIPSTAANVVAALNAQLPSGYVGQFYISSANTSQVRQAPNYKSYSIYFNTPYYIGAPSYNTALTTATFPLGYGIALYNSLAASFVKYNFGVLSQNYPNVNGFFLAYSPNGGIQGSAGTGDSNANFSFAGTRVSSSNTTLTDTNAVNATSPITDQDQPIIAAGWASRDALVADVTANPRAGIATAVLSAGAGMLPLGSALATAPVLPPQITQFPTIITSAIIVNSGLPRIDGTTALFVYDANRNLLATYSFVANGASTTATQIARGTDQTSTATAIAAKLNAAGFSGYTGTFSANVSTTGVVTQNVTDSAALYLLYKNLSPTVTASLSNEIRRYPVVGSSMTILDAGLSAGVTTTGYQWYRGRYSSANPSVNCSIIRAAGPLQPYTLTSTDVGYSPNCAHIFTNGTTESRSIEPIFIPGQSNSNFVVVAS